MNCPMCYFESMAGLAKNPAARTFTEEEALELANTAIKMIKECYGTSPHGWPSDEHQPDDEGYNHFRSLMVAELERTSI